RRLIQRQIPGLGGFWSVSLLNAGCRVFQRRRQNERQKHRDSPACNSPGAFHHLTVPGGGSRARAILREPLRIARVELLIVIEARDTASTSCPTLNGSRMLLPLNCAANCGGSTEK